LIDNIIVGDLWYKRNECPEFRNLLVPYIKKYVPEKVNFIKAGMDVAFHNINAFVKNLPELRGKKVKIHGGEIVHTRPGFIFSMTHEELLQNCSWYLMILK
jgi:hypothetical protein